MLLSATEKMSTSVNKAQIDLGQKTVIIFLTNSQRSFVEIISNCVTSLLKELIYY